LDWKRLLKLGQDEVLGLDIGSSAVRIVQLHKDSDGCVVTTAGVVDIANAAEEDKNNREINTVMAIQKCLQSMGIRTRLAVCGVSGPEVAVRDFNFPSLPPEEIEGAALLEAAQVCPFGVDDSVVDYQLIPDDDDNVCGVLVAATNKVIKSRTQLAKNASLDCVLMDVEGLALLNCFIKYEKSEAGRTTAILNVGSSCATLVIMGDNGRPFIRDMSYAGNDIVKQIAAECNISAETVGMILFDCDNQTKPEVELGDGFERACEKLILNVAETLRYYTAREKSAVIEKIFVCGSFALVKGFVELLDSRLPEKAVLWNPFEKIPCDAEQNCRDILKKKGPAMAVAAGLAMRSI